MISRYIQVNLNRAELDFLVILENMIGSLLVLFNESQSTKDDKVGPLHITDLSIYPKENETKKYYVEALFNPDVMFHFTVKRHEKTEDDNYSSGLDIIIRDSVDYPYSEADFQIYKDLAKLYGYSNYRITDECDENYLVTETFEEPYIPWIRFGGEITRSHYIANSYTAWITKDFNETAYSILEENKNKIQTIMDKYIADKKEYAINNPSQFIKPGSIEDQIEQKILEFYKYKNIIYFMKLALIAYILYMHTADTGTKEKFFEEITKLDRNYIKILTNFINKYEVYL